MNSIRENVGQPVNDAQTHHRQPLMVFGLFAMLLGVRPFDGHRWHLSLYADAVD